jgi:xylulokinase
MAQPPYILAIDLGTSGPKIALVAADGVVAASSFEPVELHLFAGGGAEQDPSEWWAAVGAAARRLHGADLVPLDQISGVSVTSQWSGTVAVGSDGAAIGHAIIWMDSRGARYVEDLIGGPLRVQGYDARKLRKWLSLTGGAPAGSGKDPLAHILYLRNEKPEVYDAAAKFLEPKDYLNYQLTGKMAASFDSIALHWVTDNRNPASIYYDDDLLGYAALKQSQLPDLHQATDVLGGLTYEAAAHLGLTPGVPVIAGTPDVHSAAIGAGAIADFAGHLYIGTSSWLTCHVPFKKTDIAHGIASLPAAVPNRYLVANEQETAGKALEWLAGILFPDVPDLSDAYDEMNRIAASVPAGSGGVIFTPWLFGERTPVEDATLRGGFFNQSLETGRPEMIRAVFEGVAYNSRWLLGYVEKFTKKRLDPIVMVGGGARSDLWCQIQADVLGRTIHQAADPLLVNVRGAGLLAHASLGHIAWGDIPGLVPMAATYVPNRENGATYDRLFDAFRRIHKANRRNYRKLNR